MTAIRKYISAGLVFIILLFASCSKGVIPPSSSQPEAPGQMSAEADTGPATGRIAGDVAGTDLTGGDKTTDADRRARQILRSMTLEEKIGQLLLVQFRYNPDSSGLTVLSPEDLALYRELKPGGVILFRENFDDVPQVIALVGDLIENAAYPPFLAVDEEGGLVSRLVRSGKIPATHIPPAERIGATKDPRAAYDIYSIVAQELRALGLNMNFAPVADILTDPDNPVIATRAFSSDPMETAAFVYQGVEGLQDNGVASVVKHFPGHGDSSGDSHYEVIRLPHDMNRLRSVELKPFQAAIDAGVAGIMTAHLYYPNIDGGELPASLDRTFLTGLLRNEMGYEGLIITDALEMHSLPAVDSPEKAGIIALKAGADMLLIPPHPAEQKLAILMALAYGDLDMETLNRAVERIISVKITQGIWYNVKKPEEATALKVLGSPEHLELLASALDSSQ